MLRFIARRFLETIPVLFIIATATFFMMRLAPGGPFDSGEAGQPPKFARAWRRITAWTSRCFNNTCCK